MSTKVRATIEDLYEVRGKAELVNGELVLMSPSGAGPGRAATKVAVSLRRHEDLQGGGHAFGDNVGFLVNLPNRESFCPDAAWYVGSIVGLDFLEGAPTFAVEVRSKSNYGPKAEREIAGKRADYFAAGTLVVWDVDLMGEDLIKVYRSNDPENPKIYRRGEMAEAEPAVPGWKMAVDELFG